MKGRKPKPETAKKHVWKKESTEHAAIMEYIDVKPPVWLNDGALVVWKSIAAQLNKLGLLDQLDVHTLATYCEAAALYQEMSAVLKAKGMTYLTVSKHGNLERLRPEYKIMQDAQKTMRSLLAEFGFSPSSRTRMAQSSGTGQGRLPFPEPDNRPDTINHHGMTDPLYHVLSKLN